MMQCVTCNKTKPKQEFYADNKTGWSKLCKPCRDKRNQRIYTRRYRERLALLKSIEIYTETDNASKIAKQIKLLQKEFKRFTLPNRTAINQLTKNMEKESPDRRTIEAFERRIKRQQEAVNIYHGQVQMVMLGMTPKPINELWRMNHGDNTRSQSQETNQTNIGQPSDISLLAVHVGDGESWGS
jgi:hypothetical protein